MFTWKVDIGSGAATAQTHNPESAGSPALHEAAAGTTTNSTTADLLFQFLQFLGQPWFRFWIKAEGLEVMGD